MKNRVRLGVSAVASPLEVGASEAPVLRERLLQTLASASDYLDLFPAAQIVGDPATAAEAGRYFHDQRVDAVCVVAATWFEDYLVLDLLEECAAPVILWGRPGMETGSLCGMQQLAYYLKNLGQPYCFLFDDLGSETARDRAWAYASAAALRQQLRRARIGFLGHRVEGMTDTTAHELALKKLFGPRVVGIDSHLFLERAARVLPESVKPGWEQLQREVGQVTATAEAGIDALRIHTALKAVIEEGDLSAVAVGCYPHLMGKVCLGISLLGEVGVPVACEGDINGALGMLILTRLTGQPVHNTDFLDPIPAENSIVFSHCGSGGFSLAVDPSQITLGPVRIMNCGVCALFPARPGPVTLINITASHTGYRMAALYGEAIETNMIFPGNPLRVRFQADFRTIIDWIAREGLGHHWMAGYGDWRQTLGDLAGLTGCEWLTLA